MSPEPSDDKKPLGTLFSPLLEAAVRLAARGHYHQFRKNAADQNRGGPIGDFLPDGVPYIAHLMGTMCILARVGVRDEVLAAAILHDYLEDVPDPDGQKSIRAALGDEVLSLVLEVTEHKRRDSNGIDTWDVRKQEQLHQIEDMPEEAVLIKAADILHNLLSLQYDLEAAKDPEIVWKPFNAGPDRQLWYFSSVIEKVARRLDTHPLVEQLEEALSRLRSLVIDP